MPVPVVPLATGHENKLEKDGYKPLRGDDSGNGHFDINLSISIISVVTQH